LNCDAPHKHACEKNSNDAAHPNRLSEEEGKVGEGAEKSELNHGASFVVLRVAQVDELLKLIINYKNNIISGVLSHT